MPVGRRAKAVLTHVRTGNKADNGERAAQPNGLRLAPRERVPSGPLLRRVAWGWAGSGAWPGHAACSPRLFPYTSPRQHFLFQLSHVGPVGGPRAVWSPRLASPQSVLALFVTRSAPAPTACRDAESKRKKCTHLISEQEFEKKAKRVH